MVTKLFFLLLFSTTILAQVVALPIDISLPTAYWSSFGNSYPATSMFDANLLSTYYDAFDGGGLIYINGQPLIFNAMYIYTTEYYRSTEVVMSGLDVIYDLRILQDTVMRMYIKMTNNGATQIPVDITQHTNVGADASFRIFSTSSGDNIYNTADYWVYSYDLGGSDPNLFFSVRSYNGIPQVSTTTTVHSGAGTEGIGYTFSTTVFPGQSVGYLFFIQLLVGGAPSPLSPSITSKYFDINSLIQAPDYTAGLTPQELLSLQNWIPPTQSNTPSVTPTPSNTPTKSSSSSGTGTRTQTSTPTTTRSLSQTPTASKTSSVTSSQTSSNTVTPTSSQTGTASRTSTRTPTNTPSMSISDSNTPTNTKTPTASVTPSRTPSQTQTGTSTQTPTNTRTSSDTRTPTGTQTSTTTATLSRTPSKTSSDTPTTTKTASETATTTKSQTTSKTLSQTPTTTQSSSNTQTPSQTGTPSISETSSSSNTGSPTSTVSASTTNSASGTPTTTPSLSGSISKSSTSTDTPTRTPTKTRTPSKTETGSNTPSRTSTQSLSATPTISKSNTQSGTTSGTLTPTPTKSSTPTPTNTQSSKPTDTASASITKPLSKTPTTSNTMSPTSTPSSTKTSTETPTGTKSPTATSTITPSPSSFSTPTKTLSRSVSSSSSESASIVYLPGESHSPSKTRTFFDPVDIEPPILISESPHLRSPSSTPSRSLASSPSRCAVCFSVSPTKVPLTFGNGAQNGNNNNNGEAISVTSEDGNVVVIINVPSSVEQLLPVGTSLQVRQVSSEDIKGANIGSTSALDVTLTDEAGREVKLEGEVELCFDVHESENLDSACLGYLDENNEWVCEDECISSDNNGKYCGTTDHFTSFAILLDGGSGTGGCGSDDGINEIISYLSLAFIILAIILVAIAGTVYEIYFRSIKAYKRRNMNRLLTRTTSQMMATSNR